MDSNGLEQSIRSDLSLIHKVEVHDNFNLELKLEYPSTPLAKKAMYFTEIYFFLPKNMNIGPYTYTPEKFYGDTNNYIRFKTPKVTLKELADFDNGRSPLKALGELIAHRHDVSLEHFQTSTSFEIRMLACVLRVSLRESIDLIRTKVVSQNALDRKDGIRFATKSLDHLHHILTHFRELSAELVDPSVPHDIVTAFKLIDEYCSMIAERFGLGIIAATEHMPACAEVPHECAELMISAKEMVTEQLGYRSARGYLSLPNPSSDNEEYLFRRGVLKRFIYTNLFLKIRREDTTTRWQHIFYGLAAGVAMAFATAVTFLATVHVAQISLSLFTILVISYIFKDRIKELIKSLFSRLLHTRFNDQTISLIDPASHNKIGSCGQKTRFVRFVDLPPEVTKLRNTGRTELIAEREFPEAILYFKNAITLHPGRMTIGQYRSSAVTHIFRYNIRRLLHYMDEPTADLSFYDAARDEIRTLKASKTYHVNLIIRIPMQRGLVDQIKLRLILDRNGIKRVDQHTAA